MRSTKTEETIICDACERVVKEKQNHYGKVEAVLNSEEFDVYRDLHKRCYHVLWKAIYKTVKSLRGEKPPVERAVGAGETEEMYRKKMRNK